MDTIEEEDDLESNRTVNNQRIQIAQISKKSSISLFKKTKNIIIIQKRSRNSSKTNISLIDKKKKETAENYINNILFQNDLSNNYYVETKKDDLEEFMSYFDHISVNSSVILVLFEAFISDKHEELIKLIKSRDSNIKILIQIDDDNLSEANSKYYENLSIEQVVTNPVNEKKYEELLSKLQII